MFNKKKLKKLSAEERLEIYKKVFDTLTIEECRYVCPALMYAYEDNYNRLIPFTIKSTGEFIQIYFPEFFVQKPEQITNISGKWWPHGNGIPRIAAVKKTIELTENLIKNKPSFWKRLINLLK